MCKLQKKLKSNCGASMILALALFLICTMVSSVIIAAAASGVSRNAQRVEQQNGYLAISSATDLILEELDGLGSYVGKNTIGRYGCKDCTVEGYIAYEGSLIYGVRLDAEFTSNPADKDYVSNPLDDGHLLIKKDHDPYVQTVKDEEKTSLDGLLGPMFERGCNQVFISGTSYQETITIALTNTDERLPDVTCIFTMTEDYDVSFQLTTEKSDYAVVVSVEGTEDSDDEEPNETTDVSDIHTIYYKKFDQSTGSYYTMEEQWAIPIEVVTTYTEISWADPIVEKEVLSQ